MEKQFKNILAKKGKKNRVTVLICDIILTVSLGILVGCSITKVNTEDGSSSLGTEDSETKDIQSENSQTGEPLPESGSNTSEMERSISDYSVYIGNFTISLYEGKQDVTDKLKENGMDYNEYDSNMKYSDSDYNKYDSYYMIGESPLGTDESQWVEASLCVYFEDGICVRLELLNEIPQTVRGVSLKDSYSHLIEQYGDSFEKQTYVAHGVYDVYRYSFDNYICEFIILEDSPDCVHDVDIYVLGLHPIYDYGEELIN